MRCSMLMQLPNNKQQLTLLQGLMLAVEARPAVLLHMPVFASDPDLSRAQDRSELWYLLTLALKKYRQCKQALNSKQLL